MMMREQSVSGTLKTLRCSWNIGAALLSCGVLLMALGGGRQLNAETTAFEQTPGSPAVIFPDEPAAHALYDKMVQSLQQAESFSYDSAYRWETRGEELGHASYQLWMKKPGFARLEARFDGNATGTLVGDGQQFWIFWPNERPMMASESREEYAKTRTKVYMREQRPAKQYSIAHQGMKLGNMCMLVMQPSIFHGNMGSLEAHLDAVRSKGTEEVGGEQCDVIELAYMKGQRSKYYWLAHSDHLPRKLKEVVRVASGNIVTDELWTNVTLNGTIAADKFAWTPPADWNEWRMPEIEEGLLKPGTEAPPFDLLGSDGKRIKLADFRGKVVWLVFWRLGCPPCRVEFPVLEQLHRKYASQGLVVLGVNCADEKSIADQFMADCSATFPNIVDSSEAAQKIVLEKYQKPGTSAVPLNYVIDKDGRVLRAWYGYQKDDPAVTQLLESLGFK